ncbi:hypothetical protein NST58_13000 [Paenibacillus sp. FSL R10-2796]|uniref:hypothetical protein n=1 Tax=Paenibacillus sp. FSL R10-2796 TaxID=2954663 RepID=UPI0030DB7B19
MDSISDISIVDSGVDSVSMLVKDILTEDQINELNLKSERTYLTIGNHTGRDLHIQVQCDVHTDNWGPNQVNNNTNGLELKSRKVNFGNNAKYCFTVWKNNAGQPGEKIGEFDHKVRFNLAGNRDHIEFTVVKINGEYNLQVWSVRLAAAIFIKIITGALEHA